MNVVELFHGRHFRITTECDINDVVNSIKLHTINELSVETAHFIRIDSRSKFYDGMGQVLKDFDMNEIIMRNQENSSKPICWSSANFSRRFQKHFQRWKHLYPGDHLKLRSEKVSANLSLHG